MRSLLGAVSMYNKLAWNYTHLAGWLTVATLACCLLLRKKEVKARRRMVLVFWKNGMLVWRYIWRNARIAVQQVSVAARAASPSPRLFSRARNMSSAAVTIESWALLFKKKKEASTHDLRSVLPKWRSPARSGMRPCGGCHEGKYPAYTAF